MFFNNKYSIGTFVWYFINDKQSVLRSGPTLFIDEKYCQFCISKKKYGFGQHSFTTKKIMVIGQVYKVPIYNNIRYTFFTKLLFVFFFFFVSAHREMRTITNYFLLNLSIADLLMSSLNCMFNFIYMLNSDWPFGSLYCSVNNFMGNVTVATSVFTLVAISFDR